MGVKCRDFCSPIIFVWKYIFVCARGDNRCRYSVERLKNYFLLWTLEIYAFPKNNTNVYITLVLSKVNNIFFFMLYIYYLFTCINETIRTKTRIKYENIFVAIKTNLGKDTNRFWAHTYEILRSTILRCMRWCIFRPSYAVYFWLNIKRVSAWFLPLPQHTKSQNLNFDNFI